MEKSPLEDPDYEPENPPVNGEIPRAVYRFGPRTQVRWFKRFRKMVKDDTSFYDYYVTSEHHKGTCCISCIGEFEDDYQSGGVIADGWCCCRDSRIG
jgi:hypothetical protein